MNFEMGRNYMIIPILYPVYTQTGENSNNSSILTTIMRNFSPVWNISSFKRSFHCIMRAGRSVRDFQRRNKPRHTQIAIVRRFWR